MFNYSLDFSRLNADILPPSKRKTRIKDLLLVFVAPIQSIFQQFAGNSGLIEKMRDRVSFTGQVIYLEQLLRREFCGGLALITIIDGVTLNKTFLSTITEEHPVYVTENDETRECLQRTYISVNEEFNSNAHFIVWVDPSVTFNRTDMQALINYYKPAGKNYLINITE